MGLHDLAMLRDELSNLTKIKITVLEKQLNLYAENSKKPDFKPKIEDRLIE